MALVLFFHEAMEAAYNAAPPTIIAPPPENSLSGPGVVPGIPEED
jgi:hypothetical protein